MNFSPYVPPTDWETVEKLGLRAAQIKSGEPYFTGWKACGEIGRGPGSTPEGAVGQIIYWIPKEEGKTQEFLYVNLPGMESGKIERGSSFNIGYERIANTFKISAETMEKMLVDGMKRLNELRAEFSV